MPGRVSRASANLSLPEILQRLQVLEDIVGLNQVQEPGAATITPSSQTSWDMAPGTTHTFYDTAGIQRVKSGALPSGDYGIQLTDPTGVAQELFPVSSAFNAANLTTTSAVFATIAGSPEVTCWIGASGDALVTISGAIFNVSSATAAMNAAIYVDGNQMEPYLSGTGEDIWTTSQAFRLSQAYGTVTPSAEHTFSFEYQTQAGTATFFNMCILVQPL